MKKQQKQALSPTSEIRDAITRSARMGEGIQTVARRHGISHQTAWGLLGEAIDHETEQEYRRGYSMGRASMLPNLPRIAA